MTTKLNDAILEHIIGMHSLRTGRQSLVVRTHLEYCTVVTTFLRGMAGKLEHMQQSSGERA